MPLLVHSLALAIPGVPLKIVGRARNLQGLFQAVQSHRILAPQDVLVRLLLIGSYFAGWFF
jgi:hypothetical protein